MVVSIIINRKVEQNVIYVHANGEAGRRVAPSVPYWAKMATALRRHSTAVKSQKINGLDLRNHHLHQLCEANGTNSQPNHHSPSQIEEL